MPTLGCVSSNILRAGGDPESRLATTFTLQDTVGIPMGASAAPIELVVDSSGQSDRGTLLDPYTPEWDSYSWMYRCAAPFRIVLLTRLRYRL
jgi:hypothetical protein